MGVFIGKVMKEGDLFNIKMIVFAVKKMRKILESKK